MKLNFRVSTDVYKLKIANIETRLKKYFNLIVIKLILFLNDKKYL